MLIMTSPAGQWLVDEEFEYAGQLVSRKAGASVGRILESYRKIRASEPALVDGLEIYSQPAAVVDSVIMKWQLEAQAAAFPCSLWLRDMLSCGVSAQRRLAGALANRLQCFIAGGCTPLLQVTDTDFAQSFKASVSQAQMELRQQCRQEAKLAGVKPNFSCGAKEILKIIRKAEALQQKRHESKPWIIAACRRNGWLHWRPDFLQNKLVDCRQQKWCQDHPEGSYRLPSRWIEERGMFVDPAGKPLKADYDQFWKASKLAADAELAYCREKGFAWKPKCLEDKVTIPEEHGNLPTL